MLNSQVFSLTTRLLSSLAVVAAFPKKELVTVHSQGTLLNFCFTTKADETVSFILDISVPLTRGFYPNAVSKLTVNGLAISGRFDLARWDELGSTFWGLNWWHGGMYYKFTRTLAEKLPNQVQVYYNFMPGLESYLWGKRDNSFQKDAYINELRVTIGV